MKNYYLIERFYGDVSNVPVPIAVFTNLRKARQVLTSRKSRGIITKIALNVYLQKAKAQHWHVRPYPGEE